MGVVYKARDTKLNREVAIKFLPRQITAKSKDRERFKIEAQAAAGLNHPNISTIHAIEEVDNEVFIVMEFIDGRELGELIEAGPLPLEQALNMANQIGQGLKAAHEKGIVHRDIKSSNIMVTRGNQIKVMDFGLAKVSGGVQITKVGTTLGTAAYMSPEQAQGQEVDHRTDIWSLGVVLYELMSGQLPFKGSYEQALVYSIRNEPPDPIPNLPIQVERTVFKALEKNPNDRYQAIDEFLRDLNEEETQPSKSEEKIKAIAVLPFDNISPDKETDYFSDGLAEELIVNLSGLKDIRVIPRTTSMRFKSSKEPLRRIGRELGAEYIITGSVRKFQENLRISVQLIEAAPETQVWAKTYKGELADIFDIQEEVSKQIVEAMMVNLTPSEEVALTKRPTVNAEAYDCYLKAREFLFNRTKNGIDFAIQLFKRAVELDPRFAAAFAGLGEAYGAIYRDFEREEAWLDKALEAGLKALMYDPSLSEAYAALGLAYFGKNSLDEALTASQKAVELDPNNLNAYWILARIYRTTDKELEAVTALEKIIEINPDFLQAYDDLGLCYERLNEKEKYKKSMETVLTIYPRYLSQNPEDSYRRMAFAVTLAKMERQDEARVEGERALKISPGDPVMMYYGACLYARLGDKKRAVGLLSDAVKSGYGNFEWIKRDPDFDAIREEPGYVELLKGK